MITKTQNPELSRKLNDQNPFARAEAAHHKLSEQEVGKLLTDPEKKVKLITVKVQGLTPNQITAVLTHESDSEVKKMMVRYQKLEEKHLDLAVIDETPEVAITAITCNKLNAGQVDKALKHKDSGVKVAVMSYQKDLSAEQVGIGLADPNVMVRIATVEYQKLTSNQTYTALSDKSAHVRRLTVINQDLNEEQTEKARSDEDKYVRKALPENKFKKFGHKRD